MFEKPESVWESTSYSITPRGCINRWNTKPPTKCTMPWHENIEEKRKREIRPRSCAELWRAARLGIGFCGQSPQESGTSSPAPLKERHNLLEIRKLRSKLNLPKKLSRQMGPPYLVSGENQPWLRTEILLASEAFAPSYLYSGSPVKRTDMFYHL